MDALNIGVVYGSVGNKMLLELMTQFSFVATVPLIKRAIRSGSRGFTIKL